MNNRARNELIGVVVGLVMIVIGVCMIISKTSFTSDFLEAQGIWKWWNILLVFMQIVIGIVLTIFKPRHLIPKIIAVAGAVLLIAVIMANSTIIIEKKIMPFEWILSSILIVGGLVICFFALFVKKRK